MKRRNFINAAALAGLGLTFTSFELLPERKKIRGTFSSNKNKVSIYTNAPVKPTRIFHITDTHLSIDDERGVKYQEFSKRMAGAYKSNSHFQTEVEYSTKENFEQTLELAKEQAIDFLALTGDIFSFPSEAAVEWVLQKLNDTGIPFAYVAGNHDWHYEGMKGSSQKLRETWTEKHLKPMYQQNSPLYAAYDFNGIRFVCIDNSTFEIQSEQLDFFKSQVKSGSPLILLMHIPLFMPGRTMGYGCANPKWGEKTDKNFEVERREKWRKGGHTKVTFEFYDEVFTAPNLLTILAGHTHRPAIDFKNGIPQIVSGHNATAYFTDLIINSLAN
ncbi:MAG: metallophosphoesterase [Prolixibacteraceae bacterium]|jgi:predicted MPP superfamily phosphohydrolase|nr:metallophosphoesterase [Prolixibacteraceae bacterium]MBT6999726.1 metallophosphoesterase [Prolixibacteraceae bacterium]MBT7394682.1 metallophosphoesterase [Prolixibacteraceae bacterium]